jgi:tetratricopeptide (TPR) repeat protein
MEVNSGVDYQHVESEALNLWNHHRSAEPAIRYVQDQMTTADNPVLRGRLHYLSGMLLKRAGDAPKALVAHREAIAALRDTSYLPHVWISKLSVYLDLRQVEEGYRCVFEAQRALESADESTKQQMRAVLLFNAGRLALMHFDYRAASAKLEESIRLFAASCRPAEANRAAVFWAESLLGMDRFEEAARACNQVRESPESTGHALVEVNLLLGQIAMRHKNLKQATVAVNRARTHLAQHMGQRDFRLLTSVLRAEADLAEARGDSEGADRLRSLSDEWTGAGNQAE